MNPQNRHHKLSLSLPIAFTALVAAGSLAGISAEPDLSKLPPPSARKGLTYEKDIRPLLEASCLRCHGEERPKAELRLDTLEGVLKGSEHGKVLTPGDGRKSPLVHAVAQIDDETAMPPKRRPGGPGGRGGFGPGMMLAPQVIATGDKDGDHHLTPSEFTAVADAWFDKLDAAKTGKLTLDQFSEKFGDLLPSPQGGGGGGGRGFNPGRFLGPGLFTVVDQDKDGSMTRSELEKTFATWSKAWDTDKKDSLSDEEIRDGFNGALPRPNPGGPGGPGAPRGPGGPGGGGFGPPPQPLTAEQVGLVRAWIDQGAK